MYKIKVFDHHPFDFQNQLLKNSVEWAVLLGLPLRGSLPWMKIFLLNAKLPCTFHINQLIDCFHSSVVPDWLPLMLPNWSRSLFAVMNVLIEKQIISLQVYVCWRCCDMFDGAVQVKLESECNVLIFQRHGGSTLATGIRAGTIAFHSHSNNFVVKATVMQLTGIYV